MGAKSSKAHRCPKPSKRNLNESPIMDRSESKHSVIEGLYEQMVEDNVEINNVGVDIRTAAHGSIESIYDGVHDGPILGYGIGGPVRLISHKVTGTEYALKILSTDEVESKEGLSQLREEIGILIQIDHPNIVKLEAVYEANDEIYLVQELCRGGDLFDRLDAQPKEHYSEAQCAQLVKQILSAVRYIHSKGIVHRDLKLENFLFDHTGTNSEMKLIDFGLSKHFKMGDIHHEPVGTRYTVAPEVLKGSYDETVDIWAIGVITFLLLAGESPFGGCGEYDRPLAEVKYNILHAQYEFEPKEIWDSVSPEGKKFISNILVVNPASRLSAEQCQKSAWLKKWTGKEKIEGSSLSPQVLNGLQSFRNFSDLRKILCEVIGFTLLPPQIEGLRREFMKLDVEQTGQISLKSLKEVLLKNAENGSLGRFTEEEVEDIFNSLRLHREQTHIQWHEFIAAELSQCSVNEKNLKLAFDRFDTEGKGYITFHNFLCLVGPNMRRRQQSMRKLWSESCENIDCKSLDSRKADAKIYFDEFALLMKEDCDSGQQRNTNSSRSSIKE